MFRSHPKLRGKLDRRGIVLDLPGVGHDDDLYNLQNTDAPEQPRNHHDPFHVTQTYLSPTFLKKHDPSIQFEIEEPLKLSSYLKSKYTPPHYPRSHRLQHRISVDLQNLVRHTTTNPIPTTSGKRPHPSPHIPSTWGVSTNAAQPARPTSFSRGNEVIMSVFVIFSTTSLQLICVQIQPRQLRPSPHRIAT